MERGREEPDCGQNAGSLKELQAKPIKHNSVIWGWVCEESIQNENYMEGRTAKHFGRSLPIFFTYLLKIKVHHWAHEGYYSCLFVCLKEFFIFFSKYELFKNAWRNFVSIKKSNDSWGNAATLPFFSQLPRQFSSTSALEDTVLTPGIALAGAGAVPGSHKASLDKTLKKVRTLHQTQTELFSLKSVLHNCI